MTKKHKQFTDLKNDKQNGGDKQSKLKELLESQTVGQIHSLLAYLSGQKQFFEIINLVEILSNIRFESKYNGGDDKKINFKIDQKIGNELLNAGFISQVIENFELFQDLEPDFLVKSVLSTPETGKGELIKLLFKHSYMFPSKSISTENMHKLVDLGFQDQVLNRYYHFESIDSYLAESLVKINKIELVADNIYHFTNLNAVVAKAFLNAGFVSKFSHNLEKFSNLDLEALELYFQKSKESNTSIYSQDIRKIFEMMIGNGTSQKELLELISKSLTEKEFSLFIYDLKDLNSDAADIIAEKFGLAIVLRNLEKFSTISKETLKKLTVESTIKDGYGNSSDIKKIKQIRELGLEVETIEKILIENNCLTLIIQGLGDPFEDTNLENVIGEALLIDKSAILKLQGNISRVLEHGLNPEFIFQIALDRQSKIDDCYNNDVKILIEIVSCTEKNSTEVKFKNSQTQIKFEALSDLIKTLSKIKPERNLVYDDFSVKLIDEILTGKLNSSLIKQFLSSKAYSEQPEVLEGLYTSNKLNVSNPQDVKSLDRLYGLVAGEKKISLTEANLFFQKYGFDFIIKNYTKFELVDELVDILSKAKLGKNLAHDRFAFELMERVFKGGLKFELINRFLKSKAYLEQPAILEDLFLENKLDISNSQDIQLLDQLFNIENGMKLPCGEVDLYIKKFGREFVIHNSKRFDLIDQFVVTLSKIKPTANLARDPFSVILLNKILSGNWEYQTIEHFLQSKVYIKHAHKLEELIILSKLDLENLESIKILDRLNELENKFEILKILETGVFTLKNDVKKQIICKLESFAKMPFEYGKFKIPENADTFKITTEIVCKKLESILYIVNYANGLESKYTEDINHLTDQIIPSLFINFSGFAPTPFLSKSLLPPEEVKNQIEEWEKVLNSFENGNFDSGNELHQNLEYTRFRKIVDDPKIAGYIKSHISFDEYLTAFNNPENQIENFNEQDSFEIECLLEEVKSLMDLIVDLKTQADKLGKELWVIPNLSYGYLPVSIISRELDNIGVRTIHGLKVGSTESHDDKEVLNKELLANLAEDISTKNPIIVVVDGTKNIQKNIREPKYPDSYQGYLNQLIALNDALGFEGENYEYAGKTDSDLVNLRAKPDFQELVIYFKTQNEAKTEITKPYTFSFWNSGKLDLSIKGGLHNSQTPSQFEPNNLDSPTIVFCNIGLLDDQIPKEIKNRHSQYFNHTPAHFDDSGKIINLSFSYDKHGIIFTNALEHKAREMYYDDQIISQKRLFCCLVNYLANFHEEERSTKTKIKAQTIKILKS